jgi:deoxyribodipyrimidine photolyase-related protein
MKSINLIFPHQLFQESPIFETTAPIYIIEEYLFFKQYPFHKQKIAFHRASMKSYADFLRNKKKLEVNYIEAINDLSDIRKLIVKLSKQEVKHINYIDPTDNWLQKRIQKTSEEHGISTTEYTSPLFLNTKDELANFFRKDKKKYHQSTFYTEQRKKRKILVDSENNPLGGKWSFDAENRKKYPAKKNTTIGSVSR